jgi:hypothetical protein
LITIVIHAIDTPPPLMPGIAIIFIAITPPLAFRWRHCWYYAWCHYWLLFSPPSSPFSIAILITLSSRFFSWGFSSAYWCRHYAIAIDTDIAAFSCHCHYWYAIIHWYCGWYADAGWLIFTPMISLLRRCADYFRLFSPFSMPAEDISIRHYFAAMPPHIGCRFYFDSLPIFRHAA